MNKLIFISGFSGAIFLLARLIGIVADFTFNRLLLIIGLVLIGIVFIPLLFFDRYRNRKKIRKIIESNEGGSLEVGSPSELKSKFKGWSMNNSPFRVRKSGLTWTGGNIHASNARRGPRKSFLK